MEGRKEGGEREEGGEKWAGGKWKGEEAHNLFLQIYYMCTCGWGLLDDVINSECVCVCMRSCMCICTYGQVFNILW